MDDRRLGILLLVLEQLVDRGFISQFVGVLPGQLNLDMGHEWVVIDMGGGDK